MRSGKMATCFLHRFRTVVHSDSFVLEVLIHPLLMLMKQGAIILFGGLAFLSRIILAVGFIKSSNRRAFFCPYNCLTVNYKWSNVSLTEQKHKQTCIISM